MYCSTTDAWHINMKKLTFRTIMVVFIATTILLSQTPIGQSIYSGSHNFASVTALLVHTFSSDPATCTAGQIGFNSTTPAFKGCGTTNTWTPLGGSGGSPTAGTQIGVSGTAVSLNLADFTSYFRRDDWGGYVTGANYYGTIGMVGQELSAHASTVTFGSSGNHPGQLTLATAATASGDGYRIDALNSPTYRWDSTTTGGFTSWDLWQQFQLSSVANVQFLGGFNPAASGSNVYTLRFDTGVPDSTFVLETCDSSFACSTTASTITPVANTTYIFHLSSSASGVLSFQVNNETPITKSTNTTLSAGIKPGFVCKTLTTASKTCTLYPWSIRILGLVP